MHRQLLRVFSHHSPPFHFIRHLSETQVRVLIFIEDTVIEHTCCNPFDDRSTRRVLWKASQTMKLQRRRGWREGQHKDRQRAVNHCGPFDEIGILVQPKQNVFVREQGEMSQDTVDKNFHILEKSKVKCKKANSFSLLCYTADIRSIAV